MPHDRAATTSTVLPRAPISAAVQAARAGRPLRSRDVLLRYRDAKGATTDRRVTLLSLKRDDDGTVTGFKGVCHMRKQLRAFRLDRVLDMADADTGELVADLPAFLTEPAPCAVPA